MSALVETMFSVRKKPWHGLGEIVKEAPTSEKALELGGLNWTVEQKEIFTADGIKIPGQYVNVRSSDNSPLGIVGERYTVVNNVDAFSFIDNLLGEGVRYETAGSLKDGRVIWLLAKLPNAYKILDDTVEPYVVFTNSHDGSGGIKVAMTPVRVVCNNTLNAALKTAKRTWSARHTGSIHAKMIQARETLQLAHEYMDTLNEEFEELYKVKLSDDKMRGLVDDLIKVEDNMTDRKKENLNNIKTDIIFRYEEAPDLKDREKTGARFIQAVSDTVSHKQPLRLTQNYQENFFNKMIIGNELLDRAMKMVKVAA